MRRKRTHVDIVGALLERGLIDDIGLTRARKIASDTGARIDKILTQVGLVSDRDLADVVATEYDLPLLQGSEIPHDLKLDERVSVRFLKEQGILPLAPTPDGYNVAVSDPTATDAFSALELALGCRLKLAIAPAGELAAAFDRLAAAALPQASDQHDAYDSGDDVERLRDIASEAPVVRLVAALIDQAVERKASDIHIEALEGRVRMRLRIDGVLQEIPSPPAHLRAAIVSRIKLLAGMNIAERRLPQDGRIDIVSRGTRLDLRVATMPSLYGEAVVMRLLGVGGVKGRLADLGIEPDVTARIKSLLERPSGIVLVSGPTGSGKTTTLYAALREINDVGRKIVTIEDPVEYHLEGVTQIQVAPDIGLSFSTVLRAILRHDPDVILVGEIRDPDTAQVAIQAAMTGHLVLSTLHTNSAAGAVARLLDMGVEPYLLASVLNGVIGQRLVRTLCQSCAAPAEREHGSGLNGGRSSHRPVGCDSCICGFSGRAVIAEVLDLGPSLRPQVLKRAPAGELHAAAVELGMSSMFDHGMRKAARGETTAEEVLRMTRDARDE